MHDHVNAQSASRINDEERIEPGVEMQQKGRVFVVGASAALLSQVKESLCCGDVDVVDGSPDTVTAESLREVAPDVVLVDLCDSGDGLGCSCLRILKLIRNIGFPTFSLVVTDQSTLRLTVEAMRLGATDCIDRPVESKELKTKVLDLIEISRHLRLAQRECVKASEQVSCLSGREREIFELVTEGWTSKEVARALDISFRTVQVHRANMMRKLGRSSLAELVMLRRHSDAWAGLPVLNMPSAFGNAASWGNTARMNAASV